MVKDMFTYLIGGRAGQGTKKAASVVANFFTSLKRDVFQMNDYPSLVRGGHNFSIVSSSTKKILSHYTNADLLVLLDQRSYDAHKNHITQNGLIVYNADKVKGNGIGISISSEAKNYTDPDLIEGIAGIAVLAGVVGVDKKTLGDIVQKEYGHKSMDNYQFAQTIYDAILDKIPKQVALKKGDSQHVVLSGSETIALGAVAAGLDLYFSYPMTPSTQVLHFFAKHGKKMGVETIHPENELAVANMAVGAVFTGARTMVGTSGGGFCLMQEAFSLAGMTEAPVLFFLGQRPGPSTGVPTHTAQGDLRFALTPGQGEFPRIVASPGSIEEAYYLTAELLSLVWRFQTPGILLSEKHLAESSMSIQLDTDKTRWAEPIMHTTGPYARYKQTETGISPLLFPPSQELIKWNSYEHDELGGTTEEAELLTKMQDKRRRKLESLISYMKQLNTVNIFGKKGPVVFTFGSTTMSVLEAIDYGDLEMIVVQPVYLEPFPVWELEQYRGIKGVVVEQNSTGQLASLLREKVGINTESIILKYDGRPFDPQELAKQLREVVVVAH